MSVTRRFLPILTAVGLATILAGCSSHMSDSIADSELVEFRVSSFDGSPITVESIVYKVEGLEYSSGRETTYKLPFSVEVAAPSDLILFESDNLSIDVLTTSNSDDVLCEILVNGAVVAKNTGESDSHRLRCIW